MRLKQQKWSVYLLECTGSKLYCGITTDLQKRFDRHVAGRGAKFTRANRPLKILGAKNCKNRSEASKLEWAIKQCSPQKKRLIASAWPSHL